MKGHILRITWQIQFLICFKCFENMSLRLSAEVWGTLTYCDRPDDSYRCILRILECPLCTSSSSTLDLDNLRSLHCVILYLCSLIRQRLDAIISQQRILSRIFGYVKNISAKRRKIIQLSHAGSLLSFSAIKVREQFSSKYKCRIFIVTRNFISSDCLLVQIKVLY